MSGKATGDGWQLAMIGAASRKSKRPTFGVSAGPGISGGASRNTGRFIPRLTGRGQGRTAQIVAVAVSSAALIWVAAIYDSGLRNVQFLTGWILLGGVGLQVAFHIANRTAGLSPKSAVRWRRFHILLGYVLIAAFVSHTRFSYPDQAFEWCLWLGFVMVALSGVAGTYVAWSTRSKHGIDSSMSRERIEARRSEIAREAHLALASNTALTNQSALPSLPQAAWMMDLYKKQLRDFFNGPRNTVAHLVGSKAPLTRLLAEIDALAPYLDAADQQRLAFVRGLAVEKNQLDFTGLHLSLARGWLLVHTPATYALLTLIVLHVLLAYAFSSGAA